MKRIGFILFAAISMSSCATIFCGSKTKVTFNSDISEKATLTIDGRKHTNVTFPYTTKIKRGFDETVVKAEAPSYETATIIIDKFQCRSSPEPIGHTRVGYRRCNRSNDETRIQIL